MRAPHFLPREAHAGGAARSRADPRPPPKSRVAQRREASAAGAAAGGGRIAAEGPDLTHRTANLCAPHPWSERASTPKRRAPSPPNPALQHAKGPKSRPPGPRRRPGRAGAAHLRLSAHARINSAGEGNPNSFAVSCVTVLFCSMARDCSAVISP